MRNKTSKIILLIFISIAIMILLIPKKQNLKKIAWRNVNGFEILIKGDLDEIEEFYTSIEKRLAGYADWIDIILTGRYSKFQKDYAPFSDSRVTFEKYYPI